MNQKRCVEDALVRSEVDSPHHYRRRLWKDTNVDKINKGKKNYPQGQATKCVSDFIVS